MTEMLKVYFHCIVSPINVLDIQSPQSAWIQNATFAVTFYNRLRNLFSSKIFFKERLQVTFLYRPNDCALDTGLCTWTTSGEWAYNDQNLNCFTETAFCVNFYPPGGSAKIFKVAVSQKENIFFHANK